MAFVLPAIAALGLSAAPAAGAAGAAALGTAGAAGVATAAAVPSWLSMAALGTSAIGGLTGAAGSIIQGNAASSAAKYNSEVAKANAAAARQAAAQAGAAGDERAFETGLRTRQRVGAIETNQAASGIDVNKGSAVSVRASQEALGQLDALTIRSNAAKEAYGYNTQASSFESESNLDKLQAEEAQSAGQLGAATTLLGSAGSIGSDYMRYRQAGLLSW